MNLILIISGIVYTLISLLVGVVFMFLTLRFLKLIHKKIIGNIETEFSNISLSLYISASIFAVGWIMKDSLEPAITAFRLVLRNPDSAFQGYMLIIGIVLLQLVIPGILSFCFILIGLWIFEKLTKDINEMEEIMKNNIALGILLSTVIIVLVLFIQPGIRMIMDGIIPFPKLGNIN